MIARRLRQARIRLGWSREVLAYHSGVSWSAIAQIESRRRRNTRPGTLAALARALGVTVDYLIGEGSPRTMLEHRALIYSSYAEFLAGAVPFLEEGLERSEGVLVVETPENIDLLTRSLGADADLIQFALSEDWYTSPLAAASAYGSFAEQKLEEGCDWIRIMGEIPAAWQDRDEVGLWTTYESSFNVMFAGSPITALCLYDGRSSTAHVVDMVMNTHPHLGVGEEATENERYRDPKHLLLDGDNS